MYKKLYKSDTNKVLTGLIGGVGEYFEVDPTLLRIGYIALAMLSGVIPAVIAYIIASLVVPDKSAATTVEYTEKTN